MSENQITIYDGITNPIDEAIRLGEQFAKSGMFGCTKTEQGTILALACFCEKKNPFELKKKYHIIDGNLTMRADAMLAEFKRRHKWTWTSSTDKEASAVIIIDGETIPVTYTWDDVVTAELQDKKNWKKNPKQMLRARLISDTVRMYDPDIVSGTYTPEEVSDFAPTPVEQGARYKIVNSAEITQLAKLEALLEPYEREVNEILRENNHIAQIDNFRDLDQASIESILSTPNHPLIELAIQRRANADAMLASLQMEVANVEQV